MKKLLILSSSNIMAHVVRPLEIAQVLRNMGYQAFFAGDGLAIDLVQQEDFPVHPLPELNMKWLWDNILKGPEVLHPVERVEAWVKAELALYEKIQPDAVLDDFRLTASISTAIAGLPHFCIMNAHITPFAVKGLLHHSVNGVPSFVGPGAEISYNQVRRKYRLAPVKSLIDMFPGTLNLLCDVPEYAPTQKLPGNFHYVGPITWTPKSKTPEWLPEVNLSQPIIYFTMGSTGLESAFQTGIAAFKGTDYQVIMTLGSRVRKEDFADCPPNIYLTQFGPGEAFSRLADVVICHAGNGTVYQVLGAGKPIIAMPYSVDQRWQAIRLSELGLGVALKTFSPEDLKTAVTEVLGNPGYQEKAQQFQSIIQNYNGPQRAAGLIHETMTA